MGFNMNLLIACKLSLPFMDGVMNTFICFPTKVPWVTGFCTFVFSPLDSTKSHTLELYL